MNIAIGFAEFYDEKEIVKIRKTVGAIICEQISKLSKNFEEIELAKAHSELKRLIITTLVQNEIKLPGETSPENLQNVWRVLGRILREEVRKKLSHKIPMMAEIFLNF